MGRARQDGEKVFDPTRSILVRRDAPFTGRRSRVCHKLVKWEVYRVKRGAGVSLVRLVSLLEPDTSDQPAERDQSGNLRSTLREHIESLEYNFPDKHREDTAFDSDLTRSASVSDSFSDSSRPVYLTGCVPKRRQSKNTRKPWCERMLQRHI